MSATRRAPYSNLHGTCASPTVKKASPIRVLIADDNATMRKLIRSFLQELPNVEICAIGKDGAEALELARAHRPDLLILDMSMPELNGVQVARLVKQTLPLAKVILFTMYDDVVGKTLAKSTWVDAVVPKSQGLATLSAKINSVTEGN